MKLFSVPKLSKNKKNRYTFNATKVMDIKTKETEKQLREQAVRAKDPSIKESIAKKLAQLGKEVKK